MKSYGSDLPNLEEVTTAVDKIVVDHSKEMMQELTNRMVGLEASTRQGFTEETTSLLGEVQISNEALHDNLNQAIELAVTKLDKRLKDNAKIMLFGGLANLLVVWALVFTIYLVLKDII